MVGMFDHEVSRAYFENEFVTGMKNEEAIPSFTVMPDLKILEFKEKIVALVKKVHAYSILVVTYVGEDVKDYYVLRRLSENIR